MQLKIRRVIKLITGEHCLNSNSANNIVQGMLVNYVICAPVLKKETVVQNNFYLSVMLFVKYGSIKRYFNSGDNLHKLHFILIDICYEWIDLYIGLYLIEFVDEMYRQSLNSNALNFLSNVTCIAFLYKCLAFNISVIKNIHQ